MIIFEQPEQMRKYHEFKGDDIRKGSEIDTLSTRSDQKFIGLFYKFF